MWSWKVRWRDKTHNAFRIDCYVIFVSDQLEKEEAKSQALEEALKVCDVISDE